MTSTPIKAVKGGTLAFDPLAVARRVIRREAEALSILADAVGPGFTECFELMLKCQGRVIVSGMGKSGHIARKVAATLASTGTPAQFVHPAEASHGDLGMITQSDVLLVLSNSGETPELADVVAHARRFGIPLIGVASRPDSTLLRESDIAIVLPPAPEACEQGIVPTTSTTMTLALGDALAIALMEQRAFTPDHFRIFHPGGKLGARLLRVHDLMHADVPTVSETTPMSEALLTMTHAGFGAVAVTDLKGNLRGIVTDGDLRRHMDGLLSLTAGHVMTRGPVTIAPDALAVEALALMNGKKKTCLLVTADGNRVAGILHIHDCLRAGVA
ncbi:KpsF/GutQ family sugar-phosphate isomerase [Xinfangfangia pollutisoli]|uniref:KpsF/GutQ family sugar-phosphate isomerase n=1 Tax=Xinfangfangia pollutisoli TaxID=2865960 RepID=UPI001CD41BA3|nr:KpsF/GutQ family sugar-phosphate isomerase [Xinfangfangia pollutisoli]